MENKTIKDVKWARNLSANSESHDKIRRFQNICLEKIESRAIDGWRDLEVNFIEEGYTCHTANIVAESLRSRGFKVMVVSGNLKIYIEW